MTSTAVKMSKLFDNTENFFESNFNISKIEAKAIVKHLQKFIEEEEYDFDAVVKDFEDGYSDSMLVNLVCEELEITSEEGMQKIESKLKIVLKLTHTSFPPLSELQWIPTPTEMKDARNYIALQCPNMIKDGENESIITIIAVGKKNNIPNFLCLMYDAFTRFRLHHKLKDPVAKLKSSKDFCMDKELLFENVAEKDRAHVRTAIDSYEARFIPGYKFQKPLRQYVDSCEVFIHYTIMVAKALKNYVVSMNNLTTPVTPLQVDLLIIPKKIASAEETSAMVNFEENSSSEDDDDDNDDDEEEEEVKIENNCNDATAGDLSNAFEKILKDVYQQKYTKEETDVEDNSYWRKLIKLFEEYVDGKNCRRVAIIIDRRTKPKDTIYVYTIPEKKGLIPADYCTTTMVFLCGKYVVPVYDENVERAGQFPFVGGSNSQGNFFMVSYQMIDDERTRLQWNFSGNGMRLTPEVMVNIWPDVFVDGKLNPKIDETYVSKEMNLNDPIFDNWMAP